MHLFFGASDAREVNLQHLYTLAKVLRVFYQCCKCFISIARVLSKNRLFEFSFTIYQTSIVCTPFNMNQHTSVLTVGLAYWVLSAPSES